MPLNISDSVGAGGANITADVTAVQQRLVDLGFDWIAVDGIAGPGTIRTIKLFQSIKNGKQVLNSPGSDGLVEVNGDTHHWLDASNAPRWKTLTASGPGFINIEIADPADDHDFGTQWLDDAIKAAGQDYLDNFLNTHSTSLLTVNDASQPTGGDTPDHAGHETGLSCDIRLPVNQTAGSTPTAAPPGTFNDANYSQDAARAVINCFRNLAIFDRAFFNDPTLVAEGICNSQPDHDNHIHIQIKAPPRV